MQSELRRGIVCGGRGRRTGHDTKVKILRIPQMTYKCATGICFVIELQNIEYYCTVCSMLYMYVYIVIITKKLSNCSVL